METKEEIIGLDAEETKFYITFSQDETKWQDDYLEIAPHNVKAMKILETAFSDQGNSLPREDSDKMPDNCFQMKGCPKNVFKLFLDITNNFNINNSNPKLLELEDMSKLKYDDDDQGLGYICLTDDPDKYYTKPGLKKFIEYIRPYYDIYADKMTQSVAILSDLLEYANYLDIGPVVEIFQSMIQFRLQYSSVRFTDDQGKEIIIENYSAKATGKPILYADDLMNPTTDHELKLIAEFKEKMPTYDGRCLNFLDESFRVDFIKKVEDAYNYGPNIQERMTLYKEIKDDLDEL